MAGSDVSSLTEEQLQSLQQFASVTGQELQDAVPLLQRSQWNVQIAITKFFDGEQADPVTEALAAQTAAPSRTSRQDNLQESFIRDTSQYVSTSRRGNSLDAAPRIVPQSEDGVVRRPPFLLAVLLSPFQLVYKILTTSLGLFTYLFPFLPGLWTRSAGRQSRRMRDTTGRRALNPRDTMARFRREFDEEFGSNELPLVDTGYATALDLAKKELKFLMVILSSPEHDDTTTFVRETLLSPDVVAFVNDPNNNIILWAGSVLDSEAYQVSTALRCTKFPFTALITHTPKEGATAMSVVTRLSGPMLPSEYLAKLSGAIANCSEQLAAVRAARSAQDFDRNIRQEQDSAYERSLRQDQERLRRRRETEAAEAAAQKRLLEEAARAKTYLENLQAWKRWRSGKIEAEPDAVDKNSVRVGLRMPDTAERIMRRFRPDADIEELYAFVECYETLQEESSTSTVSKPVGFQHEYRFQLVSPMPRMVYKLEEGGTIGSRVGRSGNIIVEPLGGEELEIEDARS